MEKLPMCRICLAENVRMYLVVNRNLHELYEKLTDIPFLTEDNRPVIACFFCCAKLKQCYQLQRQCLEAEDLFTQMMNDDYELNPLVNQGHFRFYSGFIKSPTENISIVDVVQTEGIAIKQELPVVFEGLDVIEPKEEPRSDELETENLDNSCLDVANLLPHHSESDLEDDVPLMVFKTEVEEEQEVFKLKQRARETSTGIECSFKRMLVLDTWLSIKDSKSELERWRRVFQALIQLLPDVENLIADDLEKRVTNLCTRFVAIWQKVSRKHSRMVSKYGDWLNEIEVCVLPTRAAAEIHDAQRPFEQHQLDVVQTEGIAIKQELPVVFEGRDVIEPKEEPRSDESELENLDNSCLDVADIPPHHSESDFEDDMLLMEFKSEVKEEQEVSKTKRRARETTGAYVAKKPKLDTRHFRKTKEKDAITAEQMIKDKSDSKVIRTTQIRTSEPSTYFKEPYKCDKSSFSEKRSHIRVHTGENPYKCDVCQRNFSKKRYLSQHTLTHIGDKPYKCDVCQRNFSQKCHLLQHIRVHTGEKPFGCEVCQHSFRTKAHLSRHFRIHTGDKPYKCDVCQRNFSQKAHLSDHIRVHTGEKPYRCDVCQRNFSQKSHLSQHIRVHTGEKPYRCDVCQRSFNKKGHLSQHILKHSGDKPYKCDLCQRSFSVSGSLTQHMLLHTGEKPYKCDICQRCFRDKGNFSKHTRTHTGEKPYKCDVCQRSFSDKGNFSKHILVHTGDKPYKCNVCQLSFSQKCNLATHSRRKCMSKTNVNEAKGLV